MKVWAARSQEVFDRCNRKTGVNFPDQARGWLTLHRSGLSDEQKAVVIARAGGDLGRDSIGAALRSCYPEFVAKKKAVALVDETFPVESADLEHELDTDFQDVHELLDDHNLGQASDAEDYPEADVAEVLAASWKEKRAELNRLQKSRQFGKAKELRRSFRVEVEEMKSRTSCHKCGKRGHWARECPMKGTGKGSKGSASTTPAASGAAPVIPEEHDAVEFIAAVSADLCLLDRVRRHCKEPVHETSITEVALVSCPGFGVLDSGCGRTIIGECTLSEFEKLWRQQGIKPPVFSSETHQFKYGNGEVETSKTVVSMPVALAGRKGLIKASVVRGHAPLLISRSALKRLDAALDFGSDRLRIFGTSIPLQVNQAGQYVVNLIDGLQHGSTESFAEVMTVAKDCEGDPSVVVQDDVMSENVDLPGDDPPPAACSPDVIDAPVQDRPSSIWYQEDSGCQSIPKISVTGPKWQRVFRRVVKDVATGKVLFDHHFAPGMIENRTLSPLPRQSQHVFTEFHFWGCPSLMLMIGAVPALPHGSRLASKHVAWIPKRRHVMRCVPQSCRGNVERFV